MEDIASALTASLPVDGSKGMTGVFKAADGTASAPSITFGSDTNTGLFKKAADTLGFTQGGTEVALGFPSGTLMLFQQTAAPTGWTKQTTHDNKALRVVSGTASSGGNNTFTSVFTNRTISQANLPNVSFAVTIGAGQGSHSHPTGWGQSTTFTGGTNGSEVAVTTTPSGSLATQASLLPQLTGSAASGGSGTALAFDVAYVDIIIASKD